MPQRRVSKLPEKQGKHSALTNIRNGQVNPHKFQTNNLTTSPSIPLPPFTASIPVKISGNIIKTVWGLAAPVKRL
jgi:hypothetical protein